MRTEQLQLRGSGAALILQGVFAAPAAALRWSLDEMEDLFNRIAMVSQGRLSGQEALPTAPEFYAAMVILRECLYHLRFAGVVVQAPRSGLIKLLGAESIVGSREFFDHHGHRAGIGQMRQGSHQSVTYLGKMSFKACGIYT